jgi:hypothetical protein
MRRAFWRIARTDAHVRLAVLMKIKGPVDELKFGEERPGVSFSVLPLHRAAERAARAIVAAGGKIKASGGRIIYPHRIDWRMPVTIPDPKTGKKIRQKVRIRITVEIG